MPVKYNAEVTGENARNYFLTAALIRCRDGVGKILFGAFKCSFKRLVTAISKSTNSSLTGDLSVAFVQARASIGLAVSKGRLCRRF